MEGSGFCNLTKDVLVFFCFKQFCNIWFAVQSLIEEPKMRIRHGISDTATTLNAVLFIICI